MCETCSWMQSPSQETQAMCGSHRATLLLKRHALTPFAVPAGLGATVKCLLLLRAQALALQVSCTS